MPQLASVSAPANGLAEFGDDIISCWENGEPKFYHKASKREVTLLPGMVAHVTITAPEIMCDCSVEGEVIAEVSKDKKYFICRGTCRGSRIPIADVCYYGLSLRIGNPDKLAWCK
jgi:hypothetical protein